MESSSHFEDLDEGITRYRWGDVSIEMEGEYECNIMLTIGNLGSAAARIGFLFHSVQQGLGNNLKYKDRTIVPRTLEQTLGEPLEDNDMIFYDGCPCFWGEIK